MSGSPPISTSRTTLSWTAGRCGYIEMNPADMAELSLQPGDLVEVYNDNGSTQAMVYPTPTAKPKETFMLFAFPMGVQGNVVSKGVNELVIPNYKQTWANIRKIAVGPRGDPAHDLQVAGVCGARLTCRVGSMSARQSSGIARRRMPILAAGVSNRTANHDDRPLRSGHHLPSGLGDGPLRFPLRLLHGGRHDLPAQGGDPDAWRSSTGCAAPSSGWGCASSG